MLFSWTQLESPKDLKLYENYSLSNFKHKLNDVKKEISSNAIPITLRSPKSDQLPKVRQNARPLREKAESDGPSLLADAQRDEEDFGQLECRAEAVCVLEKEVGFEL